MDLNYYSWVLVFLRVSAFMLVLPFFSYTNFPVTMRVALGALTALLLAPLVPAMTAVPDHLCGWVVLMAHEVSIGLLLGFISRMVFYAVDLAGNIISSELGLNMAAILDPASGQTSQVPGTVLFFLAAVVMFSLDLHHWVLVGFGQTYSLLPMGGAHLSSTLFETVVRRTGSLFVVALQISAPVLAVSFVVTLLFATLSRAVPQMNVFAESFSFRVAGGLMVFGFTLQLTAQYVLNGLRRLPEDLLVLAQVLAGR